MRAVGEARVTLAASSLLSRTEVADDQVRFDKTFRFLMCFVHSMLVITAAKPRYIPAGPRLPRHDANHEQ